MFGRGAGNCNVTARPTDEVGADRRELEHSKLAEDDRKGAMGKRLEPLRRRVLRRGMPTRIRRDNHVLRSFGLYPVSCDTAGVEWGFFGY